MQLLRKNHLNNFLSLIVFLLCITNINRAQIVWQKANGPYEGNIYSFGVNGSNIFVGTGSEAGVYLSTNNGSSWTAANTSFSASGVNSFAFSGSNIFAVNFNSGVFRSTDNGSSWTQVNNGITVNFPYTLFVSDQNLFLGTLGGSGTFLSTDNGTNWNAVTNGLTNNKITSFAVSGTNLFAGTAGGGIFLSSDNGASWNAVNTGLTNLNIWTLAVSGTNLFAGSLSGGVFLSTNNGSSWNAVNAGLTNLGIWTLAVSGTDLYAGTNGGGIFESIDNGLNWNSINTGLTNTVVRALAVSDTCLFAGTEGSGVFIANISQSPPTDSSLDIISFTPTRNALNVEKNSNITITFNTNVDQSTLNNSTIKIHGLLSGLHTSTFNYESSTYTATIKPDKPFRVGETVTITLKRGIKNLISDSLSNNISWQFTIKTNIATASFTEASTPDAGTHPRSIASGDWNEDGFLDLAIANLNPVNQDSNTITILSNRGNGQFIQASKVVVEANPISVVSGDWNDDGHQDLAVANCNANTISLLINNGNGQFAQASIITVGNNPYSLISGDWNCDGYQDLAVSNNTDETISILLNNENGVFTQTIVSTTGLLTESITSGDWNNDGYPDLAVVHENSDEISILLNNKIGQFTDISKVAVGKQPISIIANDWNRDGYMDIAVANWGSSVITILLNNGSGQFTITQVLTSVDNPYSITSGDYNGDGYLDLATAGGSNSVLILLKMADGPYTVTPILQVGISPESITSGDWDGDGTLDLAVANGGSNTVSILLNNLNSKQSDLVAFFPFNGGNLTDESGNGYNATYVNTTLVKDRFGNDASAYSFNGIDNIIQYGDILDEVFCAPVAKFTINGWANTRTCGNYTTGGGMIMSKSSGGGGIYQWNITHQENQVNVAVISDGIAENYLWLTSPMSTNEWFQFTLVFDGSLPEMERVKLYVNGISSNTTVYSHKGTLGTTTLNSTQYLCIGASHEYGNPSDLHSFYDGNIDDIRIYAKALTQEEIDSLYHEGGWTAINHAPTANAGPDQIAYKDSTSFAIVTLDGSASSDDDRDSLTYTWKLADSTLATDVSPTIQLPLGSHTITLIVTDKKGGLDMDQVVITVCSIPKVRVVFTLNVGGSVYAGISALGENYIYAIASGDAIYKMNTSGNVAYTIQVAGDIRSSCSIAYDSTVYIASSDRNLYAFSKDGNSVWPPLPTGGILTATPTIDSVSNCIYIGVSNKNFIAVNKLTGTVEWNFFADDQIWNSAVITSDRKLVFATQSGTLYGFDLKNLTLPAAPSWQLILPDEAPSSIASDNEGYIYIGTGEGHLLKISLPDGQQPSIEWQTELNGSISGSPVIDGTGTIYVGSSDANLYAIDSHSGEIKWTFSTNGGIRSTPVISEAGNIYMANDIGEVISLDKDKNINWYYKISSAVVAPLTFYKSTLYIGTLGNQVIALCDAADSVQARYLLKSEADAAKKPIWATFQGNNQRTGMFSYSSAGSTEINHPHFNLPTEFTLSQNYPNPFNPSTTIRYAMPKDGKVSIKIYNIIGKHIATIVDGYQQAGYHSAVFNMDNYASGVYFYQMRTGSFTDTKKMIIMK